MRSEDALKSNAPKRPAVRRSPFCLRLTFHYDLNAPGAAVRLVRAERVRTVAPGISTDPPQPDQSGAWFEVRDAHDQLLYYSVLHDPMPTDLEVHSDAPDKPGIFRAPIDRRDGEFTLIVPELANAASFSFHASGVLPSLDATAASAGGRSVQSTSLTRTAQPLLKMTLDEIVRVAS